MKASDLVQMKQCAEYRTVSQEARMNRQRNLIRNMMIAVTALVATITAAGAEETGKVHSGCCQSADPGKLVLPADQFSGKAAASYEAAKEIPDVCCKLFCYCGCDVSEKHTNLLECFASDHGVDC